MLSTNYEDNFSIDIHKFESLITERTKLFMINSPNNPSGKYYDADMLTELSEVLKKYKIPPSKVWFDPGIGFGKNLQQNLSIMKNLQG